MSRSMTACGAFTFKVEVRAHPVALTSRFWLVSRSWRFGHWRSSMVLEAALRWRGNRSNGRLVTCRNRRVWLADGRWLLSGSFWCMQHFSNLLFNFRADVSGSFMRQFAGSFRNLRLFSVLGFFHDFCHGIDRCESWRRLHFLRRDRFCCRFLCDNFVSAGDHRRLFVHRSIDS